MEMGSISFWELFSNADAFISHAAQAGGIYVYLLLFLIYFLETGIILFAILPGDSLIFVCGAASAAGILDPVNAFLAISFGAIFGNNLSYCIGVWLGNRIYDGSISWIDKNGMAKTQNFFKKHGSFTILLARFVPFVRSCAPMVAGAARMNLVSFNVSGVIGAVLWAGIILLLGDLFGNIPFVKNNLSLILITGILCGTVPIVCTAVWKELKSHCRSKNHPECTSQDNKNEKK